MAAGQQGHGGNQHKGPEAKHHLHLTEQMQEAGVARVALRQPLKLFGAKAVQQGQAE